ncbi:MULTISPECIES: mechanosensitive ion channel domain-containing protein [unclassified Pseudoalteromonas]|mgnify:CR=1 FL=1|uniref:mechanosensitive ion channel family protein n=1 Tax=unclassified Pseudoalteromonas TaxID=194690 RepID=UPI000C916303|nr:MULTISPECIES: mechanosensitive ion channel domain-containing protein [unclassified Pseudoalteromonas]MAD03280.1 mechanosensitive ion channel protein [Pseudoalteromonas sp.]MCG9708892.1 mechanosensitive ion channel family protein [Pseudoalteromonas sp. Isolate3]NIZ06622.1 mechanosensitive ion channel family protein [Pseudoalteromonas sp. HF66]RZD21743.1 mechanosensitive ion channel family protein [Pseudoalteromonas sp. MEBiC 03485]|tara:strand:+ start:8248 stop:9327 length:1080 start_codon:yes stop_codon:yes gene_type:complete
MNYYLILKNQIHNLVTPTLSVASQPVLESLSWQDLNSQVTHFLHTTWQMLPALTLGIVAIIICYLLARPLSYLLIKPLGFVSESKLLHVVTRRFFSIIIILFGVYLFLRLAGLTSFAVAIMSGTGLVGLILGFAFRDIAENFISSMLLSVQRPFRIDDVIEVDGRLGVVKKVTARATTLVDFDGNHIQIPNATVYKNVIKNLTANPKMRGHFAVGIGYDNDIRYAQQLAMKVVNQHPAVINDPPSQVLIDSLGSATLNLTIYFWVNSAEHSHIKVASQLMRELVNTYLEEQISMPDDARERIILNSENDTEQPSINATAEQQTPKSLDDHSLDDVSSDADDIREQADQSRDPEQGSNII